MSITLKELTIDTTLDAGGTIVASSVDRTALLVGSAVFTNSGTETETVTVWRVKAGVAAGATNYLAKKAIPAGKTWLCSELIGQIVQDGSRIIADATNSGNVNANLSGTRET